MDHPRRLGRRSQESDLHRVDQALQARVPAGGGLDLGVLGVEQWKHRGLSDDTLTLKIQQYRAVRSYTSNTSQYDIGSDLRPNLLQHLDCSRSPSVAWRSVCGPKRQPADSDNKRLSSVWNKLQNATRSTS